ncbi:MAG: TetR/AcrR family transcriptional regulator [Symploca sp. SIO2D2]|nr:TetR/AcrR family transcriptional regulator [Symploca sp. SIO2D2]
MPQSEKAGYHHGDLKKALVEAALQVLLEEGLDALSLRRVAREASVSPAAPYRHFKDKQELLTTVSEHGFTELERRLRTSNSERPGDLDASGKTYLAFAIEQPQLYRLMFTQNIIRLAAAEHEAKECSREAFTRLVETIETGIAMKQIEKTESHMLALSSWSLVHGISMLAIDGILEGGPFEELSHPRILEIAQSYFKSGWRLQS